MQHGFRWVLVCLLVWLAIPIAARAVELTVVCQPAGVTAHAVPEARLWLGFHHRAAAGLALRITGGARSVVVEARGLPHAAFAPAVRRRWLNFSGPGGMYGHARWLH